MNGIVSLDLADLAPDSQHHAVSTGAWVVDALFVGNQSPCPTAEMNQVIPIGIVSGKPRYLQAHHDSDLATGYRRYESSEARACLGRRPALALILIDHHHLLLVPSHGSRLLGEAVLSLLALEVFAHLFERRLSDVHERCALVVFRSNLGSVEIVDAHGLFPSFFCSFFDRA